MPGIVVFTGPSLAHDWVRRALPDAELLPPAARGDLYAARRRGAAVILLIDGVFTHRLAVSPREIVDVLGDGATVYGSSSMGAIRAAECWPAGMRGIGFAFRLYRCGALSSDDAVAVATDPDRGHAAVSVALVNVLAAVRRAHRRGLIAAVSADDIETAASSLFFARRTWRAILQQAGVADPDGQLRAFLETVNIKREDAMRAVGEVARLGDAGTAGRQPGTLPSRSARYSGHDPLLGLRRDEAETELLRWLFGSGRFQRYLWPLVVGEPELSDVSAEGDRSAALRERLATVLARLLADPSGLARRLGEELAFLEEFESELMLWHAVSQISGHQARHRVSVPPSTVAAVRDSVAIAHGYLDWASLKTDVSDGRIYGAIPLAWIERACATLALARCPVPVTGLRGPVSKANSV
jgi:hypothetical protein